MRVAQVLTTVTTYSDVCDKGHAYALPLLPSVLSVRSVISTTQIQAHQPEYLSLYRLTKGLEPLTRAEALLPPKQQL